MSEEERILMSQKGLFAFWLGIGYNVFGSPTIDGFAKSPSYPLPIIPSRGGVRDDGQAGIQSSQVVTNHLDSSRTRSRDLPE